jgi:hypothetical protein
MPTKGSETKTCFIAMPITTKPTDASRYGDENHWQHVLEMLFVPAVEAAGFTAMRPVASGSHMIHGEIVRQLSTADLVLCDLSSHNPNVFFELGVRTSLNLPVALVSDEETPLAFDTAGMNTHKYDYRLNSWDIAEQQVRLSQHVQQCSTSCGGTNPMWRQYGLTIRAQEPVSTETPTDAKLDIIIDRFTSLGERLSSLEERESQRERSRIPTSLLETLTMDAARTAEAQKGASREPDMLVLMREATLIPSMLGISIRPIAPSLALVETQGALTPKAREALRATARVHGVDVHFRDEAQG